MATQVSLLAQITATSIAASDSTQDVVAGMKLGYDVIVHTGLPEATDALPTDYTSAGPHILVKNRLA